MCKTNEPPFRPSAAAMLTKATKEEHQQAIEESWDAYTAAGHVDNISWRKILCDMLLKQKTGSSAIVEQQKFTMRGHRRSSWLHTGDLSLGPQCKRRFSHNETQVKESSTGTFTSLAVATASSEKCQAALIVSGLTVQSSQPVLDGCPLRIPQWREREHDDRSDTAVTPVRLPSRIQTALLSNVLEKDECECAGPHKGEVTDHGNESPEYMAEIVDDGVAWQ
ncbi:hypothetical protein P389DRAFT_182286 [Cystobasidium minutum MCA 4210]|uniref:uncharacterized protein n=1 Tax=Cystobasidium minutum MCA 4210 TaxID=1397322 RepID=UPI0034CEA172|eukprot:jgi/Rhomi1/182286/fgenesh1_pg.12_\